MTQQRAGAHEGMGGGAGGVEGPVLRPAGILRGDYPAPKARRAGKGPDHRWGGGDMDAKTCLEEAGLCGVLSFATVDRWGAPQSTVRQRRSLRRPSISSPPGAGLLPGGWADGRVQVMGYTNTKEMIRLSGRAGCSGDGADPLDGHDLFRAALSGQRLPQGHPAYWSNILHPRFFHRILQLRGQIHLPGELGGGEQPAPKGKRLRESPRLYQ